MATVLLVRHGRTTANASGVLAGWTAGVDLDEAGVQQAAALGQRLASVPVAGVVSSPLERTLSTARHLVEPRDPRPEIRSDERLAEVRYGDWTGKSLSVLAKDPLWRVVQDHPSAVVFPGSDGEAMAGMAARAVEAIRHWNEHFGPEATWIAVSHGDVIKAVIADALGLHLDQFQRIHVDPASLSVIRYTATRPFVVRVNDVGGDVEGLRPPKRRATRRAGSTRRSGGHAGEGDAVVGGGAGSGARG